MPFLRWPGITSAAAATAIVLVKLAIEGFGPPRDLLGKLVSEELDHVGDQELGLER